MSELLCIYRAKDQKATYWVENIIRPAKNLIINAYYDGIYFFCKKGKGHKKP